MSPRLLPICLSVLLAIAQPAAYGGLIPVVEDIGGVVNRYAEVIDVIPCLRTVRIADPSIGLAAGDRVVMIQMKGARIAEGDDSTYGAVSTLGGAGNVEYLIIDRVSADSVVFTTPWVHTYDASRAVQLVRVPVYDDAHPIAPVEPAPWNGRTGGVVAIDVTKTLVLDADIRATGLGFRAGRVSPVKDVCDSKRWTSAYASGEGGEKGEGIALYGMPGEYAAKGAAANGGGGGNGANAGGGGGGNGGNGGNGGDASDKCIPFVAAGGRAGRSLSVHVPEQRLFMGGAGGGGHQNDLQGTAGAAGGGIIMIRAQNIIAPAGRIVSQGISVRDTSAWLNGRALEPGDGAGGGGAGGSVMIQAERIIGPLTVNVRGGDGGSVGAKYQPAGPGGGGGGGVVLLTKAHPTLTILAAGGKPGVHVSINTAPNVYRRPWGATPGDSGVTVTGITWKVASNPPLQVEGGGTICDGDSLTLTASEGFTSYRWSTGESGRSIVARTSGRYLVFATDSSGCTRPPIGADVLVRSARVTADPVVNFGTTEVGVTLSGTCMLRNLSAEPITISSIALPPDVRLISPLPAFIIPTADSVRLELEFLAPRVMDHRDQVKVTIAQPCSGEVTFETRATVTGERVMFLLPTVSVDRPGLPAEIPIRVRMDSPTPAITADELALTVQLNARIFAVEGISQGRLVSNTVDPTTSIRRVQLVFDRPQVLAAESTLTTIAGLGLLSSTEQSPITISDVRWVRLQGSPVWKADTGSITVGLSCNRGQRPVEFSTVPVMVVHPNPADDVIQVNTGIASVKPVSWSIIGIAGDELLSSYPAGNESAPLTIDISKLAVGHYILRLTSTSGVAYQPLSIQR